MIRKIKAYAQRASSIGFASLALKSIYDLRVSTGWFAIGNPAAAITERFLKVRQIPGFFNVDDFNHFGIILSLQNLYGVRGDILEIGTYHGRSSSALALNLYPGEKLHLCDVFDEGADDQYFNLPTQRDVVSNIQRVAPDISEDDLVFHNCLSSQLSFAGGQKFRFVHIDGGHGFDEVMNDLSIADTALSNDGIICIDDYGHPAWPEVTTAVDHFLEENPKFFVLADVNRHGAVGRKLYISKTETTSQRARRLKESR